MFVRRELIKISEQTIDSAKLADLNTMVKQSLKILKRNYLN